jgi:hypothetical protein
MLIREPWESLAACRMPEPSRIESRPALCGSNVIQRTHRAESGRGAERGDRVEPGRGPGEAAELEQGHQSGRGLRRPPPRRERRPRASSHPFGCSAASRAGRKCRVELSTPSTVNAAEHERARRRARRLGEAGRAQAAVPYCGESRYFAQCGTHPRGTATSSCRSTSRASSRRTR